MIGVLVFVWWFCQKGSYIKEIEAVFIPLPLQYQFHKPTEPSFPRSSALHPPIIEEAVSVTTYAQAQLKAHSSCKIDHGSDMMALYPPIDSQISQFPSDLSMMSSLSGTAVTPQLMLLTLVVVE